MSGTGVWIAGSFQSDFARNFAREGLEVSDMVAEAVGGTLQDAGLQPGDIEAIHVGNAFGQLFNGQGQLGAMPATVEPLLWGVPASRHEAACASGSIAALVGDGRHRGRPLRLRARARRRAGAERAGRGGAAPSRRRGLDRARGPGGHVHVAVHVQPARRRVRPPLRAGRPAPARDRRAQLSRNAKGNPLAQTREWKFTDGSFADDDHDNPVVEGRLRRHRLQPGHRRRRRRGAGLRPVPRRPSPAAGRLARISGWGHGTAGLALAAETRPAAKTSPTSSRTCARRCRRVPPRRRRRRRRARRHRDARLLHHVASTWRSTISASPGRARAGRRSRTATWSAAARIPVNPSGGLIGVGHPVGATGVRMLLDASAPGHRAGRRYPGRRRAARSPRSTSAAAHHDRQLRRHDRVTNDHVAVLGEGRLMVDVEVYASC